MTFPGPRRRRIEAVEKLVSIARRHPNVVRTMASEMVLGVLRAGEPGTARRDAWAAIGDLLGSLADENKKG